MADTPKKLEDMTPEEKKAAFKDDVDGLDPTRTRVSHYADLRNMPEEKSNKPVVERRPSNREAARMADVQAYLAKKNEPPRR